MTRGRHPVKALEKAEGVAEIRGVVRYYVRGPDHICDFSITSPATLAQVRIKRMRYIRCTLRWLERDAMDEIAGLKMFQSSQEISRELWISSPKYFLRFFRVCDTGLMELGPDGRPLLPKSPKAGFIPHRKEGTPLIDHTPTLVPVPATHPPADKPASPLSGKTRSPPPGSPSENTPRESTSPPGESEIPE
jgi:hypothetical protein